MVLRRKDDEGRTTEVVKVCDFGIAKFLEIGAPGGDGNGGDDAAEQTQTQTVTGTLTANGMLLGTPEYMSPEQVSGEELDARSDLYSLGIILYQMLTGRVPFEGKTALTIALKHVEQTPKKPSLIAPEVDPRLDAICMKALQKSRAERYQTARDMRADLRAIVGAKDSSSVPIIAAAASASSPAIVSSPRVSREHAAMESAATLPAPQAMRKIAAVDTTTHATGGGARTLWIVITCVALIVTLGALLMLAR
jgi:serine/threonine-protein kinase